MMKNAVCGNGNIIIKKIANCVSILDSMGK